MKPTKNVRALSKLSIIILMTASLITGALLSYLWVMGYYVTLRIQIPKDPALSISNIAFTNQNTTYFNVTFFNPSYSKDATVTRVAVKTADDKLHDITLPSSGTLYVQRASNTFNGTATLNCAWDWANYTGQDIVVLAFVDEGSGPTREVRTPFVGLTITEARFNSSVTEGLTHFNLTIHNSQNSEIPVNISRITVPNENLTMTKVSPELGKLNVNQTETFKCSWNWTDYQNKTIPIAVHTVQGYGAYNETTLKPLRVEITNVVFPEPDMTYFNVTVINRNELPNFVTINKITVTLENETEREIDGTKITPDPLPYKLNQSVSPKIFKCPWDWTRYRGKNVTISVFTAQNYTVRYIKATPTPIRITSTVFDAADTNNFNITVENSALYHTSVSITNITLTFDNATVTVNGTAVKPSALPYPLNPGSHVTFRCPWNWTDYQGRNLTITVETEENGVAQLVMVTPKRVILTITSISFDPVNTASFDVTVRNFASSLDNANITRITVTFENGTKDVYSLPPSLLPYMLNRGGTVTFRCQMDWTNYRGKNITVTVYATKEYGTTEYTVSSLYTTPPK